MGMISKKLELDLIARAKAGDGEAIAALIRSHQDDLIVFRVYRNRIDHNAIEENLPAVTGVTGSKQPYRRSSINGVGVGGIQMKGSGPFRLLR